MRKLITLMVMLFIATLGMGQSIHSAITDHVVVDGDVAVYSATKDGSKCIILDSSNHVIHVLESKVGRIVPMDEITFNGCYAVIDGQNFLIPDGIRIDKNTRGLYIQSKYVTGADNSMSPWFILLVLIAVASGVTAFIMLVMGAEGGWIPTVIFGVSLTLLIAMAA